MLLPPVNNRVKFHADFTKGIFKSRGVGDIVLPFVNDAADGDRMTPKALAPHWMPAKKEQVRTDAREVVNIAPASEDLTSALWTNGDVAANSTETATTLELTGTNNSYHYKQRTPSGNTVGRTFIATAYVQSISGATDVGIRLSSGDSVDSDSAVINLSGGEVKRVTFNITFTNNTTILFGVDNRSAVISGVDTATTKVTFTKIQFEESTGRVGTNALTTPSEYVPTGKGTGEELVVNGEFDESSDLDSWSEVNVTEEIESGRAKITATDSPSHQIQQLNIPVIEGATYKYSVTMEADAGNTTANSAGLLLGGATVVNTPVAANGVEITRSGTFIAATSTLDVYLRVASNIAWGVSGDVAYFDNVSIKRIDYGLNVDGAQAFDIDNPNICIGNVVNTVTYQGDNSGYMVTSTIANYAQADSASIGSVTGDIEIQTLIQADDYTPSQFKTIYYKLDGAGTYSYWGYITQFTGVISAYWSTTGSDVITTLSTVGLQTVANDGQAVWLKITRSASTGDVNFYYSYDGDSWAQLGATVSGASGDLHSTSSVLRVSEPNITASRQFDGRIYRLKVLDGIDGTVSADFNPGKGVSDWTIQGAASIHELAAPIDRNLISNNGLKDGKTPGLGGYYTSTTNINTLNSATLSVSAGNLVVTNGSFGGAQWAITTTVGKVCTLFANLTMGTSGKYSISRSDNLDHSSSTNLETGTTSGIKKLTFTATATTTYIAVGTNSGTASETVEVAGIYIGTPIGGRFQEAGTRTNLFLNSDAAATQDITLSTGQHTLSVHGSGSVTSSDNTATSTGHGAASDGTDITFNITAGGTVTFTVSGSPDYVQVETGAYATSPIVTGGSSKAVNADEGLAEQQDNINQVKWAQELIIAAPVDSASLTGTIDILTLGANPLLRYDADNTRFELTDGTNTATVTATFLAGQRQRLRMIAGDNLQLAQDNNVGAAVSYDQNLAAGDITFKGGWFCREQTIFPGNKNAGWLDG